MDYMSGVMARLEEWRQANGLSMEDMVKMLGGNTRQQYYNWLKNDSLPKLYFRRAAEILGDTPSSVAPEPVGAVAPARYEDSMFSRLSDEDKLQVLREVIPTLGPRGRALALELLVSLNKSR